MLFHWQIVVIGQIGEKLHAIAIKLMKFVENMDQDQKAIYLDYPFQKEIMAQLQFISSVIAQQPTMTAPPRTTMEVVQNLA